MSSSHSSRIDPELLDAAIRGGFGVGNAQERAQLEDWLAQHPGKQREWEELQQFWQTLGELEIDPAELREAARADAPDRFGALRAFTRGAAALRWSVASAAVAAAAVIGWMSLTPSLTPNRGPDAIAVLETARGQTQVHTLAEGSRVDLSGDSRIEVRFDERERRINLRRGEALFTVTEDAQRPFVVGTEVGDATAVGTQFDVRFDSSRMTVVVAEGLVRVAVAGADSRNSSAQSAMAAAGQRIEVHAPETASGGTSHVIERTEIDPSVIASWRWGKLQFNGEPVSEAAADMNRHSANLELLVSGAAADIPVYGVFEAGDVRGFAKGISDRLADDPSIQGRVDVIEVHAPE